jgi:hypothetical protein
MLKKKNLAKIYRRSNSFLGVLPRNLLFLIQLPSLAALKFFLISCVILTILLLGFYVFQITGVISAGYQIQSNQKLADGLLQESKTLEIDSARVNSLADVSGKIEALGFEKMNKVYYIQMLESSVAAATNKIQ